MHLNIGETGYCMSHDPDRREEWRELTRRGQQHSVIARRENRRLELEILGDELQRPSIGDSLEELAAFHRWVMEATARGELDIGLSRTHTSAVRVQQQVYEKRDLQRQLAEVQAKLKRLQAENRRLQGAR